MSGHVNKPGNYEIALGAPFKELLELAGGVRDGRQLKAVIPGGCSMPVMPADVIMQTDLDYDRMLKIVLDSGFHGYCGIEFGGYAGLNQSRESLEAARKRLT